MIFASEPWYEETYRTITTLYQEELGRPPDVSGGLNLLWNARENLWDGPKMRQFLHDSPEGVAYRSKPAHLDPATYSVDQLLRFRGSLFTVSEPGIPTFNTPGHSIFFYSAGYSPADRQKVYAAWKARGYTHGPIGPFLDPGYHGQVPAMDFRQNPDAAADILEEVWDAGLIPIVFVIPDHAGPEGGWAEGHVWSIEELKTLEPIYRSERWQKLCRVVVNGWELQGSKYGWSNAQYVEQLSWLADVFPSAVRGLHTIADIEAPVGNGDDTSQPGMGNGDCWARVAHLIHFWLHQSSALFTPDHVADNGRTDGQNWLALWDKNAPASFIRRFTDPTVYGDWPKTCAFPDRGLTAIPGEYLSIEVYNGRATEAQARDWGHKALLAGATGFMDGGYE